MTIAESTQKLDRTAELPEGVIITAPVSAEYRTILTHEALALLAKLHRQFEPRRREALAARVKRAAELDAGTPMDFLPDTLHIREGNWKIAPLPQALQRRHVGIAQANAVERPRHPPRQPCRPRFCRPLYRPARRHQALPGGHRRIPPP